MDGGGKGCRAPVSIGLDAGKGLPDGNDGKGWPAAARADGSGKGAGIGDGKSGGKGGGMGDGKSGGKGADNRYKYPRNVDQLTRRQARLETWQLATLESLEPHRTYCDGRGVGTQVWLTRNGFFCLVCWKRFWDRTYSTARKQIPDVTGARAAAAEIPPDSSAPAARTASRRARRQRAAARAAAAKGSRRHNTSKADGKGRQRQGGGKEHRQCQADRQDR